MGPCDTHLDLLAVLLELGPPLPRRPGHRPTSGMGWKKQSVLVSLQLPKQALQGGLGSS